MKNPKTIYTSYYICPAFGTLFTNFTTDGMLNDVATTLECDENKYEIVRGRNTPGLAFAQVTLAEALRHICGC